MTKKTSNKTTKKRVKKQTSKAQKSTKILTYIAWFLATVALALSALVAGYYFGFKDAKEEGAKVLQKPKEQTKAVTKPHKEEVQKTHDVTKRLQEVLKKESKSYTSASHGIEDIKLLEPPKVTEVKRTVSKEKPKLAIIIDDVSTKAQVRSINTLKIPLTMSFLPPSPARPNSAKLAAKQSHYMVHLPMEAQNFSKEEPYTLHVRDSQQEILKRIDELKTLFPKVKYINNHTGSKFTANEVAMNRLFFAFKKEGLHFVDSRTTAQTQAPKVSENFGVRYVARDVFLDHHMEKEYVKEQIIKAVKFAQTHGKAIAIGHPHKNTLEALAESKDILKNVELVEIGKVY